MCGELITRRNSDAVAFFGLPDLHLSEFAPVSECLLKNTWKLRGIKDQHVCTCLYHINNSRLFVLNQDLQCWP